MASVVKSMDLCHVPGEMPVHVALFRNLQNGPFLREQLISGNNEFEYAFIDASTILSSTHILAATFRALNDYINNRLRSRNVHSEIVFALSPNNNIAESFRKFGLTDATTDLLVVKVSTSPEISQETVSRHLEHVVKGTPVDFNNENLQLISDTNKIRKAYKLGAAKPSRKEVKTPDVLDDSRRQMELSIIGAIALRGS